MKERENILVSCTHTHTHTHTHAHAHALWWLNVQVKNLRPRLKIPALPLTTCVILGKLLNLHGPSFLHLQNGRYTSAYLMKFCID